MSRRTPEDRVLDDKVRRLAQQMATYSDENLRTSSCDQVEREQLETILAHARNALAIARWSMGRAALKREVFRFQRALDNPGMLA